MAEMLPIHCKKQTTNPLIVLNSYSLSRCIIVWRVYIVIVVLCDFRISTGWPSPRCRIQPCQIVRLCWRQIWINWENNPFQVDLLLCFTNRACPMISVILGIDMNIIQFHVVFPKVIPLTWIYIHSLLIFPKESHALLVILVISLKQWDISFSV